jgi:iron complex transport system substrate-binding protein
MATPSVYLQHGKAHRTAGALALGPSAPWFPCEQAAGEGAVRGNPNEPSVRIVSLLPSATEMLFAIGAGEQVVGVTHECDYPPDALRVPKLTRSSIPPSTSAGDIDRHVRKYLHEGSSLYDLDAELLERLQPDLIVTQELCTVCAVSYKIVSRAAKRLSNDPRVISLEPSSLDDVLSHIRFLGELTGCESGAAECLQKLRTRIAALHDRSRHRACRLRTLVLEWTDPPMSGGHWTPGLVELAGGTPVLAHPGENSKRLEWDAIAESDPDVVVVAPCGFDLAKTHQAVEALAEIPQWKSLRAKRAGSIFEMDGNAYVNRPGPRLVDTAEQLEEFIHQAASLSS